MCQKKLPPSSHVQTASELLHHQQSRANPFFHFWLVRQPAERQAGGPARSSRPPVHKVRVTCHLRQSGVCGDSYPGFLGSLSRDEPPPFSLRTSFSLLRRIDARSLLKEPLLFREPEPSWWEMSQRYTHSYTALYTTECTYTPTQTRSEYSVYIGFRLMHCLPK